ncbi:hypothetical protein HYY74_04705 [Candidatus Woesearchaeota archaeon]|nr:hypothetical protein [Candidatus Woesearchaeota archaeon]
MSVEKIISGIVALIFLAVITPVLIFQLYSVANPPANSVIDNTAIEQARNLSEQLKICQQNYQELNKTVVTKSDLILLTDVISKVNRNVITIYETNNKYINTYISFTIKITIALTLAFSIGLFTLIDLTFFNVELSKGLIRKIKERFRRKEE